VRHRTAFGLTVLLTAMFAGPHQAEAGLRICNKGTFRYSVAVGFVDRQKGWVARGWSSLEAGECKDALGFKLDNRYYYFFARGHGEHANEKYTGETAFCIESRKFRIYQADYGKSSPEECAKDGLRSEKFVKVDVKGLPEYTINLGVPEAAQVTPGQAPGTEPPPVTQKPAAAVEPPHPPTQRPAPAVAEPTAAAEEQPARRPRNPQPQANTPPAPPAAQTGAGPNGTACQRYPNLC